MKVDGTSNLYNISALFRGANTPSAETREVFKLGREIQQINRQTDYIKEYGEAPPSLNIDYTKVLDII